MLNQFLNITLNCDWLFDFFLLYKNKDKMTSCNNFRVWTQLDDITKHLMESIAINTEKLDPIMATMIHSKTSEFKKLYTDDNVSIYWHPVRMTLFLCLYHHRIFHRNP